jgi:hypothetical protein
LWLVIYLVVGYMTWHFRHQLGASSKSAKQTT